MNIFVLNIIKTHMNDLLSHEVFTFKNFENAKNDFLAKEEECINKEITKELLEESLVNDIYVYDKAIHKHYCNDEGEETVFDLIRIEY